MHVQRYPSPKYYAHAPNLKILHAVDLVSLLYGRIVSPELRGAIVVFYVDFVFSIIAALSAADSSKS